MTFLEALRGWHDFYILTGTAAATLIGLMFVALSFSANLKQQHRSNEDIDAFVTPSMAYFAEALFIAAVTLAPLNDARIAAALLSTLPLTILWPAIRRLRRFFWVHRQDPMDVKDWFWHVVAPTALQLVLLACAAGLVGGDGRVLYGLAVVTVGLIAAGVRNAWTLVLWILQQQVE
jgi:hypothetical protein